MVYDCLVYFSIHWAKAPILYAFFNEWAKAQSNSKWMTPIFDILLRYANSYESGFLKRNSFCGHIPN